MRCVQCWENTGLQPYRVTLLTLLGRWTSLFFATPSTKTDLLVHFQMVYNWTLSTPPLGLKDLIFTEYVCKMWSKDQMHFLQCPLGLPCPRCLPLRLFRPFWHTNNHFSMEAVTPSWDKNVFWCWFWWMLSLSLSCSSKHREELSFATRSQLNVHW